MKIRMKSITYAMKARHILSQHGIDAAVIRDVRIAGEGCVYAVSVSDSYKDDCIAILKENGIALHSSEAWDKMQ
jgi:hypothetical protein